MDLEELGYTDALNKFLKENSPESFVPGRVVAEHKERYTVRTADGEYEAEITGNMRFTAQGREDFPAVGDWVTLIAYDKESAIIHKILPRSSVIKRQAVGKFGEIQIIASNIDYAFLVQAVDRDFNINRLERYLTICNSSNVDPIIVLSKTDLISAEKLSNILADLKIRVNHIPVIAISNENQEGYDAIKKVIEKGKTYCMLGSSGVGKSTLINNLSGRSIMRTDSISLSTNKGRHVTSHRELIVLDNGGILIDNPGMKEVGISDLSGGLEVTFDSIVSLAANCKFKDCTHTNEVGCAVLESIKNGNTDEASYQNYLKMEKEKAYFNTSVADKKKRDKIFGKIVKDYHKKDIKQKGH